MSGLKNPHERETLHTLNRPPLHSVNRIRLQLFRAKLLLSVEFQRIRDVVVPSPVTYPVCVAGPEKHLKSRLDEVREGWEVGSCI